MLTFLVAIGFRVRGLVLTQARRLVVEPGEYQLTRFKV
jgi:hypothetical protein